MRNLVVMKFGGSSVGDGERIRRVARLVRQALARRWSGAVRWSRPWPGTAARAFAAAAQAGAEAILGTHSPFEQNVCLLLHQGTRSRYGRPWIVPSPPHSAVVR